MAFRLANAVTDVLSLTELDTSEVYLLIAFQAH
jgi:hypothetical protein